MGVGLVGANRLMDQFSIESSRERGTSVVMKKLLPRRAPLVAPQVISKIGAELARQAPRDMVEEVQQQNQELMRALAELSRRQEELGALNRELEDTNRGVVALYAELDEKADRLATEPAAVTKARISVQSVAISLAGGALNCVSADAR